MDKYDCIKLENQLCFPLYACSRAINRRYIPLLEKLDLTYTQYITMMAMWELKEANIKTLGKCLYLDSGTLTPLVKKLEAKGYITRERSKDDERNVIIKLTAAGEKLKDEAVKVPEAMGKCMNLNEKDAKELYRILYMILGELENDD